MKRLFMLLLCLVFAGTARAHHGKDFLIVESYELPHKGEVYFFSSEIASHNDAGTFFGTEPSLLFGLAPRWAGEVHVHIEREPGQSLRYEAVAPAVHVQLTSPESSAPWLLAAAAEYELSRHSDQNTFAARLIAARTFGDGQLLLNVGGDRTTEAGTHAIYAVGFRPNLDVRVGWAIEAQGRVERGKEHQLILGVYTQHGERLTIKFGAGAGLGNGRPAAIFRTGVVWHF